MSETQVQPQAPSAPSGVEEFKKKRQGQLLPLPTGLTIRARRPDVVQMLKQGSVINPLLEVVTGLVDKGKEVTVNSLFGGEDEGIDLEKVKDMYEMVDGIVCAVFIEPKCHPEPAEGEDRSDDLLYVDEVEAEDKMFLFQWVLGGTDDLAQFRQQARADLATLAEVQGGADSTESAPGPSAG